MTVPAEPLLEKRSPAPSLPPNTTVQDDITKAGQRRVNLIWEYTQAGIALSVVACNLLVAVSLALSGSKNEFPPVLSNTLFLVVGFYFSRTNHQAIGGIGKKAYADQEYHGR